MIGHSPVPWCYARGRAEIIPPRRIHNSREDFPVPIFSTAQRAVFLRKWLVVCSFPGNSNGSCGSRYLKEIIFNLPKLKHMPMRYHTIMSGMSVRYLTDMLRMPPSGPANHPYMTAR